MRIISVMLLSVMVLGFSAVSEVYACSGGASDNIQALLDRVDYVVKADVVMVDAVRQNAMLAVHSYLFGRGPEYLVFVQTDPVIVTRMTEGDPNGACNFFQPELHPGLSAYFFLTRRADGVYLSATQWNDPNYYIFPDAEATLTFYSRGEAGYTEHVLTEADFVSFITAFGDSAVTPPDSSAIFPRLAPLKITTDTGARYLLPVDSSMPIALTPEFLQAMTLAVMSGEGTRWHERYFYETDCPGDGCTQVSPDGINRAVQRGDEIRWFGGSASGRAFQFSSTGDAIAIWHEDRIDFYTLGWRKHDQPFQEVVLLNSVTLAGPIDNLPYAAVWRPDGRSFSYSDAMGLWTLDVYDPLAEPVRLLAAEGETLPLALRYSSQGRYLQVQMGPERYTLDTVSGALHPDGLVSPDDQVLLAFDTQAEIFTPEVCYLAPISECEAISPRILHPTDAPSRVFTAYVQAEWRNNHSFIVTVCTRDDPDDCVIHRFVSLGWGGRWGASGHFPSEGAGIAFAYLKLNDTLAIVQDAFTLRIDGEVFDFSSALDGEIAAIEWLPLVFYSAR